jgi:hypothetical protein
MRVDLSLKSRRGGYPMGRTYQAEVKAKRWWARDGADEPIVNENGFLVSIVERSIGLTAP